MNIERTYVRTLYTNKQRKGNSDSKITLITNALSLLIVLSIDVVTMKKKKKIKEKDGFFSFFG